MNSRRSGIRLIGIIKSSTFLKTVAACKHNRSILIQFHLFPSSAWERKIQIRCFWAISTNFTTPRMFFRNPTWFSVISIMLKRAHRHPSKSKVRKASVHFSSEANRLQWVRSWAKFTGSFKLSWLSQQLLSDFLIPRRLKLQEFLAGRSSGNYFGPWDCSPHSPQRRISRTSG